MISIFNKKDKPEELIQAKQLLDDYSKPVKPLKEEEERVNADVKKKKNKD